MLPFILKVLLLLSALALPLGAATPAHASDSRKPPKPSAHAAAGEAPAEGQKHAPTKEEEAKREWIAHWCRRAKKDPKCKFYVEKELGKAMREVSKADRQLGLDEYCFTHKDDMECMVRKEKQEEAEKQRKLKELMTYCRENPDAPRCEEAFAE